MKTKLLGVNLDNLSKIQATNAVLALLAKNTSSIITTSNIEFIILSRNDDDFRQILNHKASLNLIDGFGVIWAVYLMTTRKPKIAIIKQIYIVLQWLVTIIFMPITLKLSKKVVPEKISGSDFAWDIAKLSAKTNQRVFLLGYKLGMDTNSVHNASLKMITQIYGLKIVGVLNGTESISEEKQICETIKKSSADILMIGLGSPKQEKWLARNLSKTGCKIGVGLGGTFDFISGVQTRAPKIIQKLGFEWLYRLLQNPRRLHRQITTIPKFLFLILIERFK